MRAFELGEGEGFGIEFPLLEDSMKGKKASWGGRGEGVEGFLLMKDSYVVRGRGIGER